MKQWVRNRLTRESNTWATGDQADRSPNDASQADEVSRRQVTRLLLLGAPIAAATLAASNPPATEACESTINAAAAATDSWKLGGNTVGKTDGSLFVGTNDTTPLVLKTNHTERMRVTADGRVGVGSQSPSAQLDVATSTNHGIRAETSATNGVGVQAIADFPQSLAGLMGSHLGGGTGIIASSDTSLGGGQNGTGLKATTTGTAGLAVRAEATATSGSATGVSASTGSPDGSGVNGLNKASSGKATGVLGTSFSPGGRGVFGLNHATSGEAVGVLGSSDAPGGRGVVGLVVAPGGSSIGVLGHNASSSGTALFADATSATGNTRGIFARVVSPDGVALRAQSTATSGAGDTAVITNVAEFGTGLYVSGAFAIFAEQINLNGYAAYFKGDIEVEGTGSIGSSVRKIDHPLDPENKYLSQALVASPEMLSVYSGNAVTDARGLATVKLPAYVEALNRDFRYQLTVVGAFAQAIVARKVADKQFTIQTDQPNVEVSWQLTGIQKDAFAEAHRVVAEVDKPEHERGLFLHAREHGAGEERSLRRGRGHGEHADN